MNEKLLYKECCNYYFYHYYYYFNQFILFFCYKEIKKKKESFLCFKYIGNNSLIKNFHNTIITSYNKI